MAGTTADSQDLRRLAKELRQAQDEIEKVARHLERTLANLNWKDHVKDRIDADCRQATAGLRRFGQTLNEHSRVVDRKASELEKFLSR